MNTIALRLPMQRTKAPVRFVIDGVIWDNYTYAELMQHPFWRAMLAVSDALDNVMMAVLTTAGLLWIVDKLQDVAPSSNAKQEYVAWGTGSTAENVSNTALHIEAAEARTLGTLSQPAADVDRLNGLIESESDQTITESGRFNLAAAGVMQQRALFTGLPLLTGDRIDFDHDMQAT